MDWGQKTQPPPKKATYKVKNIKLFKKGEENKKKPIWYLDKDNAWKYESPFGIPTNATIHLVIREEISTGFGKNNQKSDTAVAFEIMIATHIYSQAWF